MTQYFDNPTAETLQDEHTMELYVGRSDLHHRAKTIDREVKVCRALFFWNKNIVCGTAHTSKELLGEQFFTGLVEKFRTDIKPNIKTYLKKYHVAYLLKDKVRNGQYHPETLGASRVYADDRYELYRLP
jgi:hypothetical protein